jgi:hypothetical protein
MSDEHPRPSPQPMTPPGDEAEQAQQGVPAEQGDPWLAPAPPATGVGSVPPAAPGLPAADSASTPEEPRPAGVRDRVWSLRTVAATAITAVALSGAGGAALAAVSGGSEDGGGFGHGGFRPPGAVNRQGPGLTNGQLPGQRNGQVPGQVPGGLNGQIPDPSDGELPDRPRTDRVPGQVPSTPPESEARARTT